MKIKFRMRGDGFINEMFTRAWDHARSEYKDISLIETGPHGLLYFQTIWNNANPGNIIGYERGGNFEVEMDDKDAFFFALKWS